MDLIQWLIDFVLHSDEHLDTLLQQFGNWIYVLMFLVIFCETGLVVTPILPGDSLLFALGALAARPDGLNLSLLMVLLSIAAVVGDSVNYAIGSYLAPRIFSGRRIRFLNPKHLEKTHEFYERYGAKTIILARFVPIVRTFAPFVAGMGRMTYRKFMAYNVIGGLIWVQLFLLLGYFFGSLEIVRRYFTLVILGIVVVSFVPPVVEVIRERRRIARAKGTATTTPESPPSHEQESPEPAGEEVPSRR